MEKILLGYGVFKVDDTPIGLTRGGGSFNVETEYREVEADGDFGPVKGRVVIDRQVATLSLNALTAFTSDQLLKFYPALVDDAGKLKSNLKIEESDYHQVVWEGKTMDGVPVTISLDNAINLENIEFTLEDKNEVVPELTYTAAYDPEERTKPPYTIEFGEKV